MKRTLLLSIVLYCSAAFAQHEIDRWYFGVLAGMDFTSGAPVSITGGAIYTNEGTASICDPAGNLLFYTDGVTIFNRQNTAMNNGTGLLGGLSCTQAALIVPLPGTTETYYSFSNDEIGGANGLTYAIVDMSLFGGLGGVVIKNVPVQANLTEKLCAVKHANNTDYWVAVHEWGSDAFYVYPLTASGLGTPVISNTGIVYTTTQIQNTNGQMKFSPCGDKIAVASGGMDTVQIFDFNASTGVISNPVTIPIGDYNYGIEFSPHQNLLYVSTYNPSATLQQFDLTAGTAAQIAASMVPISATPDIYALQLAGDEKIYVSPTWQRYVGVINLPNVQGTACNYVDQGVDLDTGLMGITTSLGLPNIIASDLRLKTVCNTTGTGEQAFQHSVGSFPNPFVNELTITSRYRHTDLRISVHDAIGKKIFEETMDATQLSLRTSHWNPGLYFITVTSSEGREVLKAFKVN